MIGIHFDINIGRATLGRNSEATIGRAACLASSATWNLDKKSAFALGPRKTTENFNELAGRGNFRRQSYF
jgi:hypothetical protein